MDNSTLNTISLCSGVGMLDEGFHAGLGYLGIRSRTILYAEREAYPVAVLEARMEEGSLHPAPVWFGNFTELPASQFRGVVDCVVAGFPCQDLSVAGRRAGLDGKRSGLFFEVVRIATDSGARLMLLENVAGIATATAAVVDAQEGELDERAASRVVGELADLGWNAEWLTISASDVGASHGRARWFCFAWRELGYAEHFGQYASEVENRADARNDRDEAGPICASEPARPSDADGQMGYTGLQHSELQQREVRDEHPGAGYSMGNTDRQRTYRSGTPEQQAESGEPADAMLHMANTRLARPQGSELSGTCAGHWGGQETHGSVSQLCGLFAPGPNDPRWADILRDHPELSPALEPSFRSVVNGLASDMDDCRAARLKCAGNGVVATQAGCAVAILIRRSGLKLNRCALQSQLSSLLGEQELRRESA